MGHIRRYHNELAGLQLEGFVSDSGHCMGGGLKDQLPFFVSVKGEAEDGGVYFPDAAKIHKDQLL